jgi:tripartite-type tricarboxylate transporter receptor subunit TctC
VTIAPDVPTADEAGVPGVHLQNWYSIYAPKGTPKDVVGKLNAACVEILADQGLRDHLADLGFVLPAREQQSPEALGALQQAETAKWAPIIKAADIKPG